MLILSIFEIKNKGCYDEMVVVFIHIDNFFRD
jgi:hypothetical protein